MPPSNNDVGPLPPVQPPEAFHAPQTAMPHFNATAAPASPQSTLSQAPSAPQPSVVPLGQSQQPAGSTQPAVATPEDEEPDTPLDEEWVEKAKEIVGRTHADPFMQSKELGQLKVGYIKARYNKDIKAET